jgi:hypothetical protein
MRFRIALVVLVTCCLVSASFAQNRPKVIEGFQSNASPGPTAQPGPAIGPLDPTPPDAIRAPSVWDMPQLQDRMVRLRLGIGQLFRQQKFADAEKLCRQSISLMRHDAAGHYLLACSLAQQGKDDDAIASLSEAVDLGFNRADAMRQDANFVRLQKDERFTSLVEAARAAKPEANPWRHTIAPGAIEGGIAKVTASNTGWDARIGVFVSLFKPPARPKGDAVHNDSELGRQINAWYAEGTAAGNVGDFYDNHDTDHSVLRVKMFPQFTRIRFADDAKTKQLHTGLQNRFIYNGVVIGNSSTALVGNPFWRSQARLAYTSAHSMSVLYVQYNKNHMYVYPEHNDHDAEHGDVFPANTPYVIVTQGSSWSDGPVLEALAHTLAAFRPADKEFLVKNGALMPTLQFIMRMCHNNVKEPDDYLTGKAHPTVFHADGFSAARMVASAREFKKEETPALARLKVLDEDRPVVGRDYFDPGPRQELFTTPAAIARVHRTTKQAYRMLVSAEDSVDLNGRKLAWHWKVLRGDPELISIKPINAEGSVVEIFVKHHPKRAISPGSAMTSNRVDLGCFVHNGVYYSAPAFITFFSLANENRVYNAKGLIESVEYKDATSGGAYVDPMIDIPKHWKDVYQYDEQDRLIGWTRQRDGASQHFTADGAIVIDRDAQGRPQSARTVRYTATLANEKTPPTLVQTVGDEMLYYEYAGEGDRVGKVVRREKVGN